MHWTDPSLNCWTAGKSDHEDEFHITTFFRVRFAGVPLLSTLELLLFGYSNIFVRAKAFLHRDHLKRIYLNRHGVLYSTDCSVFSRDGCSRLALIFVFFIRGIHPVCGEPLFCFSANPDSLSELCGFHIDHRSRSFLLQVSGVSSHLSFCCTSLVSGFYYTPKREVHETRPKLSGRMCPVMSLIATVLFKEPSFGTWVHTFGFNFPHGPVLADVLLRPAVSCYFPPAVPPQ